MTNNNKTILKRFLWTFKDTFFKIFTIIVFFSLLYSFINIFGHGGAADLASSYGNIAFDWNFVQSKFKGYFCSNFSWLCIGVSVVIIFFLKKKKHIQKSFDLLFAITSSTGFLYAVALALFKTFTLLRYQILIETIIVFNCTVILGIYWCYCSSQIINAVALTLLLATQSMLTIDPVMLHVYRHIHNNGLFPMITSEEDGNSWIGDYSIYNYQYSYLDRCIQKLLLDFDYNKNIDFFNFNYERGLLIGYGEAKSYGWNCESMEFSTKESSNYIPLYYYSWLNDGTRIEQQELLDVLHEYAVIFLSEDYPNNIVDMCEYLASNYDYYEERKINDGLYGSINVIIAHNKRFPLSKNKKFNSYNTVGEYRDIAHIKKDN